MQCNIRCSNSNKDDMYQMLVWLLCPALLTATICWCSVYSREHAHEAIEWDCLQRDTYPD